jgi:hypothetical protein
MNADEFAQRYHGLDAMRAYLVENLDRASGDEVFDFVVASAELVRDTGGDMRQYIDSVCDAFPSRDAAVKQELRDALWTKLSC